MEIVALPWQTNFLECADNLWPTQRSYQIMPNSDDIEEVAERQGPMGNASEDYTLFLIKKFIA